jgi:hypothetical protein
MSTPEAAPVVFAVSRDEFAHLQREIARRADQLARSIASDRHRDLALWLRAEQEIFARAAPAQPFSRRT